MAMYFGSYNVTVVLNLPRKKTITVQVLHDADSVVPNPPKVIP